MGNTPIDVIGDHFIKSPQLFCMFGSVVVKATYVSKILMTCVSPPLPTPPLPEGRQVYQFGYSVDGQYFVPAILGDGTPVTWTAMEEPTVKNNRYLL